MSVVELLIAAACVGLGVRSIIYWLRRPVALESTRHRVLFAVFVTARSGMWFCMAGLFAVYGTRRTIGRAFNDDIAPYRVLAIAPILLAIISLGASAMLAIGDGADDTVDEHPAESPD